jgi:primosomal protein DnaI
MGVGKTYLAACAANERARKGDKTAFIHYPTFTMRMAAQINDGEYRTELKRLMYADFLVIDDIGAENCTEWNRDQLLLPLLRPAGCPLAFLAIPPFLISPPTNS